MTFRVGDFIILMILPILFFFKPKLYKNPILVSLLLSLFFIIFSSVHGYIVLNVAFSVRDINEIFRLSKPLILIVLLTRCDSRYLVNKVNNLIPILSLFLIILAFLEYFNPGGLALMVGSLYAKANHLQFMISGNRRIVLSGTDPNVGAAIAALFFLFNFFKIVIYKKKIYIVSTFLFLIIIMMTSSRTIFLALAVFLFIFLLTSKSVKFVYKFILVLGIVGFAILLYDKFEYISKGFPMALKAENQSLLVRFESWRDAWDIFLKSPLFGWGIAKSTMTTIVDGEYFLLLRRYGILGTFTILLSIFLMPFWNYISIKKSSNKQINLLQGVCGGYIIVIAFIMITGVFYSGYQLFLPFVFISTILYMEKKKASMN